jgi:hypothetical protein
MLIRQMYGVQMEIYSSDGSVIGWVTYVRLNCLLSEQPSSDGCNGEHGSEYSDGRSHGVQQWGAAMGCSNGVQRRGLQVWLRSLFSFLV